MRTLVWAKIITLENHYFNKEFDSKVMYKLLPCPTTCVLQKLLYCTKIIFNTTFDVSYSKVPSYTNIQVLVEEVEQWRFQNT